jgi:hypothetical protein
MQTPAFWNQIVPSTSRLNMAAVGSSEKLISANESAGGYNLDN